MNDKEKAQVESYFRQAIESGRCQRVPASPEPPRTIHYTQLAPAEPDSPLAAEWETYRREVGRLLAEGNEGRFVLIKGETIIELYDTRDIALREGYLRYPGQSYLVHEIQTEEPLLRAPWWLELWHASRSQCKRTG